jgi:hypothetical protein
MSNDNSNSKKTFFCVYGIIVLWLMAANLTALGQTKTEAPKPTGVGIEASTLSRMIM